VCDAASSAAWPGGQQYVYACRLANMMCSAAQYFRIHFFLPRISVCAFPWLACPRVLGVAFNCSRTAFGCCCR
jgi:hypothetical protein